MNAATERRERIQRRAPHRLARPNEAARLTAAKDFARVFPNEDACLEFAMAVLLPSGITRCAKCAVDRKHHRVNGRKAYACDRCGRHVHPLSRTVFARSSTSLRKWFYALWLLDSSKGGITAKGVQREIGVTYKTAWRMLHRLRPVAVSSESPSERLLEAVVAAFVPFDVQGGDATTQGQGTCVEDTNHDLL